MDIGDAIAAIAAEAERQGFSVRQTRTAMWHFRKEGNNWTFRVRQPEDLLEVLSILVAAGLDWAAWSDDHDG